MKAVFTNMTHKTNLNNSSKKPNDMGNAPKKIEEQSLGGLFNGHSKNFVCEEGKIGQDQFMDGSGILFNVYKAKSDLSVNRNLVTKTNAGTFILNSNSYHKDGASLTTMLTDSFADNLHKQHYDMSGAMKKFYSGDYESILSIRQQVNQSVTTIIKNSGSIRGKALGCVCVLVHSIAGGVISHPMSKAGRSVYKAIEKQTNYDERSVKDSFIEVRDSALKKNAVNIVTKVLKR